MPVMSQTYCSSGMETQNKYIELVNLIVRSEVIRTMEIIDEEKGVLESWSVARTGYQDLIENVPFYTREARV